ncbi:MAG: aromatic amino acid transport family protein [Patescibacteria group bacterium]
MDSDSSRIWSAARPLIGTMIGVGILGLPYAILQVGIGIGILELFLAALISYLVLRLYGDLVMIRGGKARFIQVIGRELGHLGTGIAAFAYIGAAFGALLAYIIFGGQFLRVVTFSMLPMTTTAASVLFFTVASIFTVGGALFVARTQKILIPLFIGLIVLLMIVAAPHMTTAHVLASTSGDFSIPLGVMFFAFHGISAVPEMRDILGRRSNLLPKSIARATIVVALVYAVFCIGILAVTGSATTENAILGLSTIGKSLVLLASGIALLTTFNAYTNVATQLTNTFLYDLRMRFLSAWFLTTTIPFVLFLAGAQRISSVLSITGGVLGSLTAIMMLIAYERARVSADLPKNSLQISQWAIGLTFVVFIGVMVTTVIG